MAFNFNKFSGIGRDLENLSKVIANQFFQSLKSNSSGNFPISSPLFNKIRVLGKFIVQKNPNYELTVQGALGTSNNKNFTIQITVYNDVFPIQINKYNKLYTDLLEVVRHEIEHIDQTVRRKLPDGMTFNTPTGDDKNNQPIDYWIQYLTSPNEVEAFVSALYFQAKKTRTPIITLINQELNNHWYAAFAQYNLSQMDIIKIFKRIKVIWLNYALKRYPNLQGQI